mgnify:CR=1 FL=1
MSRPDDEAFNLDAILGGPAPEAEGAPGLAPEVMGPPPAESAPPATVEAKPPRPSLRERLRGLDIFTIMLGLSLLAIIIAVVMLAVELSRYQWDTSARSARQTVQLMPIGSEQMV